jgi:hypothetical protein
MNDSKPIESKRRRIEVLRWVAVLPTACFASWVFGGAMGFLLSLLRVELRGPGYPEFLFPLQQLLPSGTAFALVGALVAPRLRLVTAAALAAFCILMSVQIHIVGQSNPGLTNYMHSTGESLGAVIGVVVVVYLVRRSRQRTEQGLEDGH